LFVAGEGVFFLPGQDRPYPFFCWKMKYAPFFCRVEGFFPFSGGVDPCTGGALLRPSVFVSLVRGFGRGFSDFGAVGGGRGLGWLTGRSLWTVLVPWSFPFLRNTAPLCARSGKAFIDRAKCKSGSPNVLTNFLSSSCVGKTSFLENTSPSWGAMWPFAVRLLGLLLAVALPVNSLSFTPTKGILFFLIDEAAPPVATVAVGSSPHMDL